MGERPILLATVGEPDPAVRAALDEAGFPVQPVSFDIADVESPRLMLVDSYGAVDSATSFCRRWRQRSMPLVWLADGPSPESRAAGWRAGADVALPRPLALGELAAQVTRLVHVHEEWRLLETRAGESAQINQTLIDMYAQVDADFRIARRIQMSCRPTNLPALGHARFAVHHRERTGSAGDFHNVVRVDEDHVAFLLGDVTGQSLTSCMLAVYLHQSIKTKEIDGKSYRVLAPDEVLRRMARDLLALGISDLPLVRVSYGLLHTGIGELTYCCAGHLPPLFLSAGEPATFGVSVGPLFGSIEPKLENQYRHLRHRDRFLLSSDRRASESPPAIVEPHRELPLPGFLAGIMRDLVVNDQDPDDMTMLAVEFE